MILNLTDEAKEKLDKALNANGLRTTRQREQIYAAIHQNKSHPTAEELYSSARTQLQGLSLATVYNCLETLVSCGLVREVHSGRPPVRYEPANEEHAHFFCEECGSVFDIEIKEEFLEKVKEILPKGFHASSVNIRFEGHAECEDEDHCEDIAEDVGLKLPLPHNA